MSPIVHWRNRQMTARLAVSLVLCAAVAGCTVGAASDAPPVTAPPASQPPSGTASQTPAPSVEPSTPTPAAGPPAAELVVAGAAGPGAVAQLGTYVWRGEGSDAPWLPGTPVVVDPGASLVVRLGTDDAVADWTAVVRPPGDPEPGQGRELGSGRGPLTFTSPAAGSWSLQVVVTFADGQGEAAYYWLVEVE
jgi:hypothetical protein